jgi:hypothetical protein
MVDENGKAYYGTPGPGTYTASTAFRSPTTLFNHTPHHPPPHHESTHGLTSMPSSVLIHVLAFFYLLLIGGAFDLCVKVLCGVCIYGVAAFSVRSGVASHKCHPSAL